MAILPHDKLAALPNSLLTITLTSNFGTFILYALSCFLCIVAFHKRPDYNFLKHTLIPGFGLLANLVCMGFYVAGPFFNLGTKMEPLTALGISAVWGLYGAIYFLRSSKAKGKAILLESKQAVKSSAVNLTAEHWVACLRSFFTGDGDDRTTQWSFSRRMFQNRDVFLAARTAGGRTLRRRRHVGCTVRPGQ